jgi:hypothetical protein
MSPEGTELQVERDWQDVLARSSVISRRRRRKRHVLVTAAALASLAAVAGPALTARGWLDGILPGSTISTKGPSASDVQRVMNPLPSGQPVALSQLRINAQQLTGLRRRGLTGVRRLSQTNGIAVYALDFKNRRSSYPWGPAGKRYTCYQAIPQGGENIWSGFSCPGLFDPVAGSVVVSNRLPTQADGAIIASGADGVVIRCQGGRAVRNLYTQPAAHNPGGPQRERSTGHRSSCSLREIRRAGGDSRMRFVLGASGVRG